eukprot:TRINITY_DN63701_c0_g1_i1.p1 TRINITY_DN63701_c0_g1~~TRINITY_DN63701_c0_g1_i1.p1  ORF type:complete len:197 (-),score=27.86 TRINITY_DN63701_c0_g1_i1:319-909(-)
MQPVRRDNRKSQGGLVDGKNGFGDESEQTVQRRFPTTEQSVGTESGGGLVNVNRVGTELLGFGKTGSVQFSAAPKSRAAMEREYTKLQIAKEQGQETLSSLDARIQTLRQQVDAQRQQKPSHCASCRAVTMQVDAAAQSLLGSAGHVARTLLRNPLADRQELLRTVLRYVEPVKHLDPELDDLYERAHAALGLRDM